MSAAVTLAFAAGLLATVNPCGFALLPAFLSFYLGADEGRERSLASRLSQGFLVGLVLSGTFGAVFVLSGLIVSAGLRSFLEVVPWVALAVGAGLVLLGLAMVAGRQVSLIRTSVVDRYGNPRAGYAGVGSFGAAYALASLSCTLPIFLIVVSQALAVADPVRMLGVFGAYAAGSATVLVALSVSAALAKGALARALRSVLPAVNRIAGALLVASGVYLFLYWLPPLMSGDPAASADGWAARASKEVSSNLANFFSANIGKFAILLAALALAGIVLGVLRVRGRAGSTLGDQDGARHDADGDAPLPNRLAIATMTDERGEDSSRVPAPAGQPAGSRETGGDESDCAC